MSTSTQLREEITCCVVGGGPAGAMLALLLARQGVEVTLLEAHRDFERDFRGDTLHASTMEILDEIGQADRLLKLRHAKVRHFAVPTKGGPFTFDLFSGLKTRFPYIVVMAQSRFLEFVTEEAKRYPNFRLAMGARVEELVEEDGVVRGVRYRERDGWHEVHATLTVGADGRFSKVRKLVEFEPIKASSPIDVLWFRISRRESDPKQALAARVGSGMFMVFIDRFDYWQVGCTILKGGYRRLRDAGLEGLRRSLATVAPEWADRFDELEDWKQIPVLSVEISRLKRWHKPGLLLIGDAAHVMSPVGGVGINYAIQDAVVASNVLGKKLATGTLIQERDLAEVQRRRELPIRVIQTFQSLGQRGVARGVLSSEGERAFAVTRLVLLLLKSPRLLAIPARFLSFGLRPPHVEAGEEIATRAVDDSRSSLPRDEEETVKTEVAGGFPTLPVVTFAEATNLRTSELGAKAANLARLASARFPVPPGFVVTPAAEEHLGEMSAQILEAAAGLCAQRFAVRSSGTAEDLEGASFAGQYETLLDVRVDELPAAVGRVFDSASASRVAAYRDARAGPTDETTAPSMAVLVQAMVEADASGVAFTANPLTGERSEVVITAARGLGERLVSGEAVGDEWVLQGDEASCRRESEGAITAEQAVKIAELARRVEAHFGSPQDVEWAISGDVLYLLQARPMTALPEAAEWEPPAPGYWMRNFRLGEWLPEAMTPLFADWLLALIEGGYLRGMRSTVGAAVPFRYASINGWYYTTLPDVSPRLLLRALVESRGRMVPVMWNALIRVNNDPVGADRAVLRRLADEWSTELLPRYQRLVTGAQERVESATPAELVGIVDEVGTAAGEYLFSLAMVGGSAWKMEAAIAKFFRRHLAHRVDFGYQVLLRGMPGTDTGTPPHAVQSVDWYRPTLGELGLAGEDPDGRARQREIAAKREVAEQACRAVLADRTGLLVRFDALLEVAQRYAGLRERQARDFALSWPLLRRCALRLGEALVARGVIDATEDIFFLARSELDSHGLKSGAVANRRRTWERQRRLAAPLTLGVPPKPLRSLMHGAAEAARTKPVPPDAVLVGEPASPGRASGAVRIVHSPEDFRGFRDGEVLVARLTAPAWTPLFGRAAAVVTDGGTLAAHASLVAREYGIPAVVGAGDATLRLRDGQAVTVDGGAGTVELGR
jgi:rifampicin phosphotransferase